MPADWTKVIIGNHSLLVRGIFNVVGFLAHYTDVLAHLTINYECQIRIDLLAYLLAYIHSCTFKTLACS